MRAGSYKAAYRSLEALAEEEGGRADRLISLRTKPFFVAREPGSGAGDGRVAPGAWVSVVDRSADALRVRIDGWQQEEIAQLIYALPGKRIVTAALGRQARTAVVRGESLVDPDTDLTWQAASLEAWVTRDGLLSDAARFWDYAHQIHSVTCSVCHPLPTTDRFVANAWTSYLGAMRRNIILDGDEYLVLLRFLQLNASDVRP